MKLILFDLDGTLTDSAPGITRCVQYAFDRMGYPKYSQEELNTFVGPPLYTQFAEFAGMSEADTLKAIAFFRERYDAAGKFENSVYPGIPELLDSLREAGIRVGLATSKAEKFAVQITEHFNLRSRLDYLAAASMDGSRVDKPDIIGDVLVRSGFADHRQDVTMVGDRKYDIEGAKAMGLAAVGVTYGYGSREELEQAGADRIADSVAELKGILLEAD